LKACFELPNCSMVTWCYLHTAKGCQGIHEQLTGAFHTFAHAPQSSAAAEDPICTPEVPGKSRRKSTKQNEAVKRCKEVPIVHIVWQLSYWVECSECWYNMVQSVCTRHSKPSWWGSSFAKEGHWFLWRHLAVQRTVTKDQVKRIATSDQGNCVHVSAGSWKRWTMMNHELISLVFFCCKTLKADSTIAINNHLHKQRQPMKICETKKKLGLLFNEDLVEHRTSKSCRVITKGRHFVLLHCIMTAWKLWAFQLSVRITLLQRKTAPLRPWTYSDFCYLLTECQLFYTLLLILSFYLQLNITTNIDTEGFIKRIQSQGLSIASLCIDGM